MNYFPPCVHASKVVDITTHSDASGLALLVLVNEEQGLQIKKNGKWIIIKPVPGAFIYEQIVKNGEYTSIEHRGGTTLHCSIPHFKF